MQNRVLAYLIVTAILIAIGFFYLISFLIRPLDTTALPTPDETEVAVVARTIIARTRMASYGTPEATPEVNMTGGPTPVIQPQNAATVQVELTTLEARVDHLQQQVDVTGNTGGSATVQSGMVEVEDRVEDVDNRLSAIEEAVIDDAGEILQLEIMKQTMDSNREIFERELASLRRELGRLFSITMAILSVTVIAVLGLVVREFVPKFWQSKEGREEK